MFSWIRTRKRRRFQSRPFPEAWEQILRDNAVFSRNLSGEPQGKLRSSIQVLVAEKNWEGCGGLIVTDEHRVTIAAQMARMTLGFAEEYFEDIQSILIYPSAYLANSANHIGSGVVIESQSGRLGEAWYRGPVVLSWSDVLSNSRRQDFSRNIVVHEFAHQLDMRNGRVADGIPVIESEGFARHWQRSFQQGFEHLQQLCSHGRSSVIDCYGATNPAEFFAVASESYFEEPRALQEQWPTIYELLTIFYHPKAEA